MIIKTYGLAEDELMHYGVLGMKWGHRKAVRSYMSFENHRSRHDRLKERASVAEGKGKVEKARKLNAKAAVQEGKAWRALGKSHTHLENNAAKIREASGKKLNKLQSKDMATMSVEKSVKYQEKAIKLVNRMGINLATYANKNTLSYDAKLQRHADEEVRAQIIGGLPYSTMVSALNSKEDTRTILDRQAVINNDAKTFSSEFSKSSSKKKKKYHQ